MAPTPDPTSPRRWRVGLILATIVALAIGILYLALVWAAITTNGSHQLTTLSPHGIESQRIQDLITPVFIIAGVVFVLVFAAVIGFCLKFRDKGDDREDFPVQRHGSNMLEIGWTILPALILLVVAVFTVATIIKLNQTSKNALQVEVSGQQWWWAFHYDMNNDGAYTDTAHGDIITATELVIPVGREVDLTITSNDVIHSFWIPALNGKKDAVPGQHHPLVLQANKIGVYRGPVHPVLRAVPRQHAHARAGRVAAATSPSGWPTSRRRRSSPPPTRPVPARPSSSSSSARRAT